MSRFSVCSPLTLTGTFPLQFLYLRYNPYFLLIPLNTLRSRILWPWFHVTPPIPSLSTPPSKSLYSFDRFAYDDRVWPFFRGADLHSWGWEDPHRQLVCHVPPRSPVYPPPPSPRSIGIDPFSPLLFYSMPPSLDSFFPEAIVETILTLFPDTINLMLNPQ